METKGITQKEYLKLLCSKFLKLINTSEMDEILCGNSYWRFTDRKIELINPAKVKINQKGLMITSPIRKDKLLGKSILDKKGVKNGRKRTSNNK